MRGLGTQDALPWNARVHASQLSSRGSYAVDRDRVVHCETFRELQHKTQVQAVAQVGRGPGFRTRLNHVIEVAQIAGALADRLSGNRALAEAIALAHDLGHPPFGHAGERALTNALRDHGEVTWNANLHSLAVVDHVEAAFVDFPGLNLTWATREGIARHSTPFDEPESVGEFTRTPQGGLECQIVDAADILTYIAHDLDDAVADGFIELDELRSVAPLLDKLVGDAHNRWSQRGYDWPPEEEQRLLRRLVVARLISHAIRDLEQTSERVVGNSGMNTADEVRSASRRVVAQSDEFAALTKSTLDFLLARYYRSDLVRDSDAYAQEAVRTLFEWYFSHPDEIPKRFRVDGLPAAVATYIASLNDRTASARAARLGLEPPTAEA